MQGDVVQYLDYARNLLDHGIFSSAPPGSEQVLPDNYRDPLYPAFLWVWVTAVEDGQGWYTGVLYSQALLGSLTVLCVMLLGLRLLSLKWVVGAGTLIAVRPHSVTSTGYVLAETLTCLLCALALLLHVRAVEKRSTAWMLVAGVVLGLAGLTNAVLLPFGVFLALVLLLFRTVPVRIRLCLVLSAVLLPAG